jgi:hypothetical protein
MWWNSLPCTPGLFQLWAAFRKTDGTLELEGVLEARYLVEGEWEQRYLAWSLSLWSTPALMQVDKDASDASWSMLVLFGSMVVLCWESECGVWVLVGSSIEFESFPSLWVLRCLFWAIPWYRVFLPSLPGCRNLVLTTFPTAECSLF